MDKRDCISTALSLSGGIVSIFFIISPMLHYSVLSVRVDKSGIMNHLSGVRSMLQRNFRILQIQAATLFASCS
jgi:hypothetical protein